MVWDLVERTLAAASGKSLLERQAIASQFFADPNAVFPLYRFDGVVPDLLRLCTLEWEDRSLVSYPVLATVAYTLLKRIESNPEVNRNLLHLFQEHALVSRFSNPHWKNLQARILVSDNLHISLRDRLTEGELIEGLFCEKYRSLSNRVRQLPWDLPRLKTDFGHGVDEPIVSSGPYWPVWSARNATQSNNRDHSYTAIVVDDENPDQWMHRLRLFGFTPAVGDGTFTNAKSALAYLRKGKSDLVLTDFELGEGATTGIDLARSIMLQDPWPMKLVCVMSNNSNIDRYAPRLFFENHSHGLAMLDHKSSFSPIDVLSHMKRREKYPRDEREIRARLY